MIRLLQLPAWRDNYIWLLAHGERALVVDPAEASVVLEALEREGLTLETLLNTHHHPDHVGGNEELVAKTGCRVVGPAHDAERIPAIAERASIGDTVEAIGLSFRVLDVRAHTRGHICFALDTPLDEVVRWGHDGVAAPVERLAGRPLLFAGDALFLGGCGRLFEGTAEQLARSMEVFAKEAPEALVCCAHEYTESNLRFGAHVYGDHAPIRDWLTALDEERRATGSSVPDTLARELETNVFLLALNDAHRPALSTSMGGGAETTAALVGELRSAKDSF